MDFEPQPTFVWASAPNELVWSGNSERVSKFDVITMTLAEEVMRISEVSSGLHWAARRPGSTVPTVSTWGVGVNHTVMRSYLDKHLQLSAYPRRRRLVFHQMLG